MMTNPTEMDSPNEARSYVLNVYSPLIKVSGHSPRIKLNKKQLDMAHWCVLEHCDQVGEYLRRHTMEILREESSQHYSLELHSLARKPQSYSCFSQCYVNGVKFVVWSRDRNKRIQNSGVMVEDGDLTYYGIIENIIELRYANGMHVVLFDCTWFNTDPKESGSTKMDYGLLSVDTSSTWYEDWPYCLATTARQVFTWMI
ncbi:unnamed protein product [Rhodiola kirilowii]